MIVKRTKKDGDLHRKYVTNDGLKDQYYTKDDIAIHCIRQFKLYVGRRLAAKMRYIELAAGAGSFSSKLDRCSAFDIEPGAEDITKVDDSLALDFSGLTFKVGEKCCSIGNPPFGRHASNAKKFFNKSAEFADYIAFIVPRTFRKTSVINRLDDNFHLVHDEDLPKNSFTKNGVEWDVRCIFQIWERRDTKRAMRPNKKDSDFFDFVRKSEDPDYAVRRAGASSGKIYKDDIQSDMMKIPSNLFIRVKKRKWLKFVWEAFQESLPYWKENVIYNTAAIPSLSRGEMVLQVDKKIRKKIKDSEGK